MLTPQEVQAFIVQQQHGDPELEDIEKLKQFMSVFTQDIRRTAEPDEEPYFTINEVYTFIFWIEIHLIQIFTLF